MYKNGMYCGLCIKRGSVLILDSFHPYSEQGAWRRFFESMITAPEHEKPSMEECRKEGYELVEVSLSELSNEN